MADLSSLRDTLEQVERRINSPATDRPGAVRRAQTIAAGNIRDVLMEAVALFLSGLGHPPPKLDVIEAIVPLIKSKFTANVDLAESVGEALGGTSSWSHARAHSEILADTDVSLWLDVANRFVDALEPILAERRMFV